MTIIDILLDNDSIAFQIDSQNKVRSVSCVSFLKMDKEKILGVNIIDVLNSIFKTTVFDNEDIVSELSNEITRIFKEKNQIIDNKIVTNKLSNDLTYKFNYEISYMCGAEETVFFRIANFHSNTILTQIYEDLFDSYSDRFILYSEEKKIGKYIIDYDYSSTKLYANRDFPDIVGLDYQKNNYYSFSRDKDKLLSRNIVVRDNSFLERFDKLKNSKKKQMTDEWYFNNRWLKIDMKVIERYKDNNVKYLGGVVSDITYERNNRDLIHMSNIYKMALQTGDIGVFFYDLDKHPKDYFEANSIYGEILGIDEQENGYYLFSDFEKTLIFVEESLQDIIDVKESLNSLFEGQIKGTTNQILKIVNQKTNEEKYLISSSKVVETYDDNTPKKLGGVIQDITERIQSQKDNIDKANKDDLTTLYNKRKLMSDMNKNGDGIGVFLDLDNFKQFNDNYGHSFGDKVLRHFAKHLLSLSKKHQGIKVYRLYGDEFFAFLEGYTIDEAKKFIEEIKQEIKDVHLNLNIESQISASYGVSEYKVDMSIDDFIKEADYAMYENKIEKRKKRSK